MRQNKLTPAAGPLGLLEEDSHGSSLNVMLQGLTRFFLETIVQDHKKLSTGPLTMEHVRISLFF